MKKITLGIVCLALMAMVFVGQSWSLTAEENASSAKNPPSFDELMKSTQKQMDQMMKTPFFLDPSLDHLRGFDAFDKGLEQRMQNIFKSFGLGSLPGTSLTTGFPNLEKDLKTSIREDKGNLIVTIDLPGHDKKSIDLKVRDNALILSSERKTVNTNEKEGKVYSNEISYGKISRVIELPRKILEDQLSAKYDNGVLTVTAPIDTKVPSPQEDRKIEIQ